MKSAFVRAQELEYELRKQWIEEQFDLPQTVRCEVRRLLSTASTITRVQSTDQSVGQNEILGSLEGHLLLNRFEVVSHLGNGAMGDVYAAFDRELNEVIAFKTLRHHLASVPDLVQSLRREVQLARRVRHHNVCQIFDLHQDLTRSEGALVFFTMELLAGENLAARIGSQQLRISEIFEIAEGLAAGLEAIHSADLVHRDLKPGNIFLLQQSESTSLRPVITDFGLCFDQSRPVTETLTTFGHDAVVGTPAYMAPEQLLGRGATKVSDVYAFGVILFEMLTRASPL